MKKWHAKQAAKSAWFGSQNSDFTMSTSEEYAFNEFLGEASIQIEASDISYAHRSVWLGSRTDDFVMGNDKSQIIVTRKGDDMVAAGAGNDLVHTGRGNDIVEAGSGNDYVKVGRGDDFIYSFSWAGEPEIDQDADAQKDEPIEDDDVYVLSKGKDTINFRWLIDAKDAILDKHRDATGDVDYRKVAGEITNVHDHWVEAAGDDTAIGYNPNEDTLIFEGHTVTLDRIENVDADKYGKVDNSVAYFYSEQGGAGAHQGDQLGSVTFIGYQISANEIDINKGVFYGTEDLWSATG